MSGPIVRTGTNPKFWSNWDKAFGSTTGKKKGAVESLLAEADKQVKRAAKSVDAANKAAMEKAAAKKSTKKAAAKAVVKKTATKKTAKKAAKKKA